MRYCALLPCALVGAMWAADTARAQPGGGPRADRTGSATMTAASGKTTVPGTVRGLIGNVTTMMTIGRSRGGFAAARRVSACAMETVATTTGRDSDRRSVADHRHSPRAAIATTGMTTETAGAARRSAEGRAVSRTLATAAQVVTDDALKRRSAADRRRSRCATAADRLVEARRHSRFAVVRTGGRASAAMEAAAHSPVVVVPVSAASAATASAAMMTDRALALVNSRIVAALPTLGADRVAAGAGGVMRTTAGAIGPGMMTATD